MVEAMPDENGLDSITLARTASAPKVVRQQKAPDNIAKGQQECGLSDIEEVEILLHICSFLGVRALRSLACVSRCFGAKLEYENGVSTLLGQSVVEESARRLLSRCNEKEQAWVRHLHPRTSELVTSIVEPTRLGGAENWTGTMHEVELLRCAAVFGRSHECIKLSQGGSRATTIECSDGISRTAASNVVMRAGCHFAEFTVVQGWDMCFGVILPGWNVHSGATAQCADGHCFYHTGSGCLYPGGHYWLPQRINTHSCTKGDRIGLLLDLDRGSMTVYKNNRRLGVMVASGLSEKYCWAVSLRKTTWPQPTLEDHDTSCVHVRTRPPDTF